LNTQLLQNQHVPKPSGDRWKTCSTCSFNYFRIASLLAAAAGEFGVLITGDRNRQYQQSASQLRMSVVVLIAPNSKLESFLPLVGRLLSTLATLQEPRNIELEAGE
jgi:hypothetical protein